MPNFTITLKNNTGIQHEKQSQVVEAFQFTVMYSGMHSPFTSVWPTAREASAGTEAEAEAGARPLLAAAGPVS